MLLRRRLARPFSSPPSSFSISADVSLARTPPGEFYAASDSAFAAQREAVFASAWHFCPQLLTFSEAPSGSAMAFPLLRGGLDEPLLAVRDGAATRVLSNACSHRGMELLPADGVVRSLVPPSGGEPVIRCGYHGVNDAPCPRLDDPFPTRRCPALPLRARSLLPPQRRFALSGACRGTPGFARARRPGDDDLPAAETASWRGLPFVRLPPPGRFGFGGGGAAAATRSAAAAAPFDVLFGDLLGRLSALPIESLVPDPAGTRAYTVACHWAIYVENFLEGLHVPFVHPGLNLALDMGGYRTELHSRGSLQIGPAKRGAAGATLPPLPGGGGGGGEEPPPIAGLYAFLFPNLMFNFYPWGLSVNVVVPEAPRRTRIDYFRFRWPGAAAAAAEGSGAGGDLDTVEREDDAVVEAVQRTIGARMYARGRYSERWETGTHHFNRLLADAIGGAGGEGGGGGGGGGEGGEAAAARK